MSDVIEMPVMTVPQEQAWLTLLELYEEVPGHWTLVGGQMVHLWCAERGRRVARPTDDADAVLDVRMKKSILWDFTAALKARGFKPETASSGVQHRWRKGDRDPPHPRENIWRTRRWGFPMISAGRCSLADGADGGGGAGCRGRRARLG